MKDENRVKIKLSSEQKKDSISRGEILVFIASFITILYAMVNTVYVVTYKNSCERFYGIPQEYFQSSIDKKIVDLFWATVIVVIFLIPVFLKKYNKKYLNSDKVVSIYIYFISPFIGFFVGLWNAINLSAIVDYGKGRNIIINYFNNNAEMTVFASVLFGIIAIVGYVANEKSNKVKNKFVMGILIFVYTVSIVTSILLTIFGVLVRFTYSVEDKQKYEFIEVGQDTYAVITHYNEDVLVVEYKEENGNLYLYTDEYFLYPETIGKYTYKQFIKAEVK